MRRAPPVLAAAIGLALLAHAGGDGAAAARLHGEPPETAHALSYDGSKTIVKRERSYDVVDTGSGESLGPFGRSFVAMRWGEDSDTAYGTAKGGGIWRLSFAAGRAAAARVSLTGGRGIAGDGKLRVEGYPTPVAPVFFARAGGRLHRCAPGEAAGGAEIGASCEIADADAGRAFSWLIAAGGRIAARTVLAPSGEREFQAAAEAGGWRKVFRYTPHYTELTTIGGVQADNSVWALSNRNREGVALVRLDVASGTERVFHERPGADVDQAFVLFDREGEGTPMLAVHQHGHPEVVHFEPRLRAAYAALRRRIGEPVRIDLKSGDRALKFAVVEARSPAIHRRWYLLDLEAGISRELSAAALAGYLRPAAPSRPVSFPASDGLVLHGYLTLPRREPDGGPPPIVLMLHGGPWSRDRWPGPPLVRFLGSRGYAVLRLNYRGSIGYGRAYVHAGRGALFGELPRDVLDAARWAVREGHAAEGRIALFGGSFGGFLALAMLGRHPGVFRAGIALNAPTDAVAFWKRDWPRASVRVLWQEFLASRDLPEAALARLSPVNNFGNFDAPVLLLAGARDRRVPPEHSFELFDLLRAAGKPASLFEYRGVGHNLPAGGEKTREHIARAIEDFLAEHMPADVP